MSTQRGSGTTRKRPQKNKNSFAFKNNLHDKTPQVKRMNQLNVCEVCARCKAQIEWKIKYKKYKALSQAKTCIRCSQRTVIKAYHVVCKNCAKLERICAKCLKSGNEVNIEPPDPTTSEQQHLKTEMDRLIKSLPERKRRTFLRYMKKGKEEQEETEMEERSAENDEDDPNEPNKIIRRIPHTREDLLNKIKTLKLNEGDEDDEEDDDYDDSDLDDFNSSDDEFSTTSDNGIVFSKDHKQDLRKEKAVGADDSTDSSDLECDHTSKCSVQRKNNKK